MKRPIPANQLSEMVHVKADCAEEMRDTHARLDPVIAAPAAFKGERIPTEDRPEIYEKMR